MVVSESPLISNRNALILSFMCLLVLAGRDRAQAATDPTEAAAMNAIWSRWDIQSKNTPSLLSWNISGDLCTGAATNTSAFDDKNFNPAIKCVCTGATCHITGLKVYALEVTGSIPNELQNLPYLDNLNLAQNYLTGPLPVFLGNLTAMKYFTVGINALSGTVPKELGKLRNAISLSIGTNNFSGSLPPEFGNLTNLEQLYINSCGLGGELLSTVSKLKNLQTLWAMGNDFSGKFPDLTQMTSLTTLRLQGNSLQGPIPSNISSLTNLTDLRLGDISNGSSSLKFISTLTSLTTLILRNCRISDTLPSDFSRYTSLQLLDLSFNNLTGPLPQSLFSLGSLQFLFLGNNSLSGSLPAQKNTALLNIDLSYNQLSGSFPTWVSLQNIQLNLVENAFVIDNSNNSVLPGLKCLQRDKKQCYTSPVYASFAINSGGNASHTSPDGTVYDPDSQALSAASYYVTDSNKWAVSSVGSFLDASQQSYILNSLSQFSNTLDPELYQNSRISPSSLRYFGLGLENGNYTIKLHFAEVQIQDRQTWESTGKRVFDIYIQGNLVLKDFDIRKEAGRSFKAVVKNFTAPVTNYFLEIHLFWAGKGTCCVPFQGYYGPSISAISVSPGDFIPTVKPPRTASTNNKAGLVVGITVGVSILVLVAFLGIFIYRQRKRLTKDDKELLEEISSRPNTFSYAELRAATEDFSPANKLGEGGFGPVFKGKLSDGRTVAVKQLSVASHQGKRQFLAEIATISAVQHRNLVKLYGCCIEGGKRLIVYEYLENKSLDQAIFSEDGIRMDWSTRFEVCLGTARGLAYLHEESSVRIVHRDVKASNVLLDADLNPKISDFGLAKLYDDKQTHISTRVAGTIGYLAPEYAMRGHLTEKADVFGFGVLALEVLSGRSNSDQSFEAKKVYLLEWAWQLHESKHELELVDSRLPSFNEEEAIRLFGVALLCTQASPLQRPPMSKVVAMLTGDIEVSNVTSKPGYLTDWQYSDISSSFAGTEHSGFSNKPLAINSQVSIQSNVSLTFDAGLSPSPSQPMLHEIIGDGR